MTHLDLSRAEGNIRVTSEILKNIPLYPSNLSLLPGRDRYDELRALIGRLYGVGKDKVTLGNGSDELIEIICRTKQGGKSVTLTPTFERLFEVNKKIGLQAHTINLPAADNYRYSESFHGHVMTKMARINPDIIWLCSPNNPTGTIIEYSYLEDIATTFRNALVVIDTAFLDIVTNDIGATYVKLLQEFDNILILSSFSKAWGLSALRLGFAISSSQTISMLNEQKIMFNVNTLAVDVAVQCIENEAYRRDEFDAIHRNIHKIRTLVEQNTQYELVANSDMNLFCLRYKERGDLYVDLYKRGVKTKSLDKMPGMENERFCRISVPRDDSSLKKLLDTLSSLAA